MKYDGFSLFKHVLLPLILLIAFTPWSAQIDQFISHVFYQDGHFASSPILDFFYDYGIIPAWFFIAISIFILIGSYFSEALKKRRLPALFLIATLTIGSGLIIHLILKDHWGRPRPRQVIEYGGNQPFRPYYKPNLLDQPEPSKSFPCGHCSMGFFFFSLALIGFHYRQSFLYWLGMGLAWGLGLILGLVRIAQGGHFFSDVIISALIMWWTTLSLYYFLFARKASLSFIQ